MALATRTIEGNNSGLLLRVPKVVVMHSTRSGIASKTDASELTSTINWFLNPAGASAHWIISKVERVRAVADTLRAWHSAWLNGLSWGIEFTQPTIDRTFGAGHYANAALIGRHYVSLGVKPVWLDDWDGNLSASGFVDHEDTIQGRASGKSDMGYRFDRPRFIASLEDDMPTTKEIVDATVKALRPVIATESAIAATAAVKATATTVANIRKSLTGGMFPGAFIKFDDDKTVYWLEYAGGIWVRHSVRNPTTFRGIGGEGPVLVLKASQRKRIALGPTLPNLAP